MGKVYSIGVLFLACWLTAAGAADRPMTVHPAFWTVHGKTGTAYILSSIHALPPDVSWHRLEIDAAAKSAGTYIFEVANGSAEIDEATRFIRARGQLPDGETLHALLSPVALKDYDAACALAGMSAGSLDDKRPWLAAIMLTVSYMNQRHLTDMNTPDEEYFDAARRQGKALRYFDTTQEQLEFLSRYDQTMGISGFSTMLGDFTNQPSREDALITAWSTGDTERMAKLIAENFRNDPEGARIFASHNRRWTQQLEAMLESGRTYFIVVGVAHLVGPDGVPALLRSDGYSVDGP